MRILVFNNADEVAKAAAMVFASTIYEKPDAALGLATGSTPVKTYKELIRLGREKLIDFSRVRTFNLDEYVGLAGDHACSYRYFMNDELFDHINIDKANTHVPSGLGDVEKNAKDYDALINQAGGIDLQLLGIGTNGHIGFNEPNDAFVYDTNIVTLTESTITSNAGYFDKPEDMPKKAISLGVGGIMKARKIMLIATGKGKAEAIRRAAKEDVTPNMPASILRLHQNATMILDEEAASLL